ncbi:TetR/AcrR family transcriptional regulator [Roseivirga sp. BDSF3-8]|uniref:TetR/AcrR family transcriptional regulator n=1 Tax=Roseivirga sp. BDSF3-8 TaxID=3241598 RepID=UPI0035321EEB
MEVKDKIIHTAEGLFLQYGIRSVTMDDIAKELGISKKTIYQYFNDKEEVVCVVTRDHLSLEKAEIESVVYGSENAIEVIQGISRCMRRNVQNMNPSLLFDLKKYHHKAYKIYEEWKQNDLVQLIEKTLKRGMEEGLFREDINPSVLAIARIEQTQMGMDPQVFPRGEFDLVDVQYQLFNLFMHGILSDKGRAVLSKYEKLFLEK